MIVQSGHRIRDAYGENFTRGLFDKACHDGPACNPYKLGTEGAPHTTSHPDFDLAPGQALEGIENPHQQYTEGLRSQTDEESRELFENLQGRLGLIRRNPEEDGMMTLKVKVRKKKKEEKLSK